MLAVKNLLLAAVITATPAALALAADDGRLNVTPATERSAQDDPEVSVSLGLHYTSGKYGGTETTRLWYLPFTVMLDKGDWGFDLTLPYLRQSGPTGQTVVSGRVVAPGSVAAGTGGASPQTATSSGMGDVVAGITRYFGGENDNDTSFSARLQTKFGTADQDKGLGTGKNDYTALLGASKPLDRFTLTGQLGYTWYGSPAGVTLKNAAFTLIDGSYKVGAFSRAGAALYYSQAIVDGSPAPQDLTLYWKYKATKNASVRVYLLKGLSNGSADYGAGLSTVINF